MLRPQLATAALDPRATRMCCLALSAGEPESNGGHSSSKTRSLSLRTTRLRRSRPRPEKAGLSGIYKGVIVENSEVGASSLKLTRFLYRYMCGNHIIWGAEEVSDVALRHVGSVRRKFNVYSSVLRRYAEESVSDLEAKIRESKTRLIAGTKEEVLDALFGKRSVGLSRKTFKSAYEAVEPGKDGDPRTPWGIAQGVTRFSQSVPFADKRTELDRAAGRILDAF